jgi:hypothetical protein
VILVQLDIPSILDLVPTRGVLVIVLVDLGERFRRFRVVQLEISGWDERLVIELSPSDDVIKVVLT